MVKEMELFESPDRTPLDICLWGWMTGEVNRLKVDKPDELLAGILDAAGCIEKRRSTETNNTRSSHASCKVH